MLYTYNECIDKYGNDYRIKKELDAKRLFQKEKGIYSDKEHVPELSVIVKKYDDAVFTLFSAFYYHGLTDTIPRYYYVSTAKNKRKISDSRIKQIYDNSADYRLGMTKIQYEGTEIPIYGKERLLIELIRHRNRISFDLYKEIISSYRNITNKLDMALVTDYALTLPKTDLVMESLRMEVL